MEANMHGHMAYFAGRTPSMEVLDDPDLLLINSGLPSDTFNVVCRAQLAPDTLDARIEFAIDYFKSRHLPMAWWVGPTSGPPDLGLHLERHGLACTEHHTGMVADLHELAAPSPDSPGLTIRPVTNRDELRRFSIVIASVFDPPDPSVPLFYEQVADLAIRYSDPIYLYLGCLDGEPVATSVLYLISGVAGIFDVTTVEWARGRGIGTAMTVAPLRHAVERGYTMATLQASEQGQNMYARIGFRSCCAFQTYQ
jgi:hypothetical protein